MMKIVPTMASEATAPAPKRRLHSLELKNLVITQAPLPGASISSEALSHGINADIVHRWLRERAGQGPQAPSGFVALSLPTAKSRWSAPMRS